MFTYFEREKEQEQGRGREKRTERTASRLHAVSAETDALLEPVNREMMIGAEIESLALNRLSHPGTPS